MPTVLVTGAAGFIGSHVAEHCLKLGMEVVAVDDLSGGFVENVPPSCHWVQGDLTDPSLVARLFREHRFDHVYHLAAYAAEGLSHFIRRFNYTNNLLASVNLINESVKQEVETFVFTSSIAVYGAAQTPMTEAVAPRPEDPYGVAKYAVELDLEAAHRMFGLEFVIFRPHNVYGERQNIADRYRNVIGIFMNQCLQQLPMTIFGDGTQTRAFSHVDDVAPIIAASPLVAGARNQTFNIGADRAYSVQELALEVAAALGVVPDVEYLPMRQEVLHAFSDHSKARAVFGQGELVDLRAGLARMAAWVLEHGSREPVSFRGIEVLRNLPASWRAESLPALRS